ncbi:MAG: hypothetical protein J6Z32_00410 [Bacteroidales bacterium]|nr:hypothetical protein [Bacteroidales bacterium]
MKRNLIFSLALMMFLLGSLTLSAQDGEKRGPNKQMFNKDQIVSQKIAFFTKFLDLTPEEAQKFWPVYNACQQEMEKARKETRKSAFTLSKALKEGDKTDEEISSLAETYYGNLDRENSLQKLHYAEYQKVLPIKKAARVRLLEEQFTRNLIMQLRGNYRGGKPGPKQPQPKENETK